MHNVSHYENEQWLLIILINANRRSVLISGASSDIGESMCQRLKELDWKVIATDRNRIQSIKG